MIEGICILVVYIAWWLSMFLQAFAGNKIEIIRWGMICLLIGWIIAVGVLLAADTNSLNIEIPDWVGCILIALFFASSLGGGYLCGRRLNLKHEKEK